MEILSCNSSPCCQVVNLKNWKLVPKTLNSSQQYFLVNQKHQTDFTSQNSLEGSNRFKCKAYVRSSDSYVIGREEDDVTEVSASNVLIPSLPNGSNGESSASISSCFWEWKPKLNVHYEKAGFENVGSPNVLFLPGFGVGSFHYEKQLKDLGRDNRVWALDFLGQGLSLPFEDPAPMADGNRNASWGFGDETESWAYKLVYSIDLWQDQVRYFIEEVIGEPVYVVGNSLGGYVALYFAALNPHLVKGVTLLNATPFWGFLPNPIKNPLLSKLSPWAGTFPLPANIRRLTEFVWEKISDPTIIAEILNQVYADHSTNVESVFSHIIKTTRHPAAAASLASIMFAPQAQLSFNESLSRCQKNKVPICLMYGKEDPWVKPLWGMQVKRKVPEAPYYQISLAGHCPHDEVPEVINFLLRGWIRNVESHGSISLPLLDDLDHSMKHTNPGELEFIREGSRKSAMVRFFGPRISIWDRLRSYINSQSNLKQHNGEIKGGAKASRAGRPWICACIICGFADRSEACAFESKWKVFSRRNPRKNQSDKLFKQNEDASLPLLQHRHAALNKVKGSLNCTHLEINWHLDPS